MIKSLFGLIIIVLAVFCVPMFKLTKDIDQYKGKIIKLTKDIDQYKAKITKIKNQYDILQDNYNKNNSKSEEKDRLIKQLKKELYEYKNRAAKVKETMFD